MLFLGNSSIYSSHINHSGQDSITKIFFRASIFRSGLEACLNKDSSINPVSTKCRLQTADRVQNADQVHTVFPSERDNMSSYNLPSVTQSLFRDHLSRLFALMWNIPCRFLITIVLNIISGLHLVFSLSARVSWCDGSVCDSSIQFSLKIKN